MQKLCQRFLKHRKLVIALFLLAALVSAACIPFVRVNYNLTDYLPEESPSTRALNGMKESFDSGIPNMRLFVEGIDLVEAESLVAAIEEVEGVEEVSWLGDAFDTKVPLEVGGSTVDDWATTDGFLYQIVVCDDAAASAVPAVRSIADSTGASQVSMSGQAVNMAYSNNSAGEEMTRILVAAVAIIIIILLLVSSSWFEPVIFLSVIGIAILLNMGTNIFLGEISFITQLCAAVLQLAVSMDYAIVMLHTFRRCQETEPNPERAMAIAMRKSFAVILSSAAVTFFGFLSLTVMQFRIGVDMGVVLSKGIVMSFFTIMFLMPCLSLAWLRPLDKLEHRSLVPNFGKFAAACTRIAVPMAIAVAVVAVPAYLGESQTHFMYGSSNVSDSESPLGREEARINSLFGSEDMWVIMVPEGDAAKELALACSLEALDHVTDVQAFVTEAGTTLPIEMAPETLASKLLSNGWSRLAVETDLSSESPVAFATVEQAREIAREHYGDDYLMAGQFVSTYDLKHTVEEDSLRIKLVSMGAIALVLAFTFRSLSIPVIVLAAIEVAIWINLAIPYFLGQSLQYIGYLVIDAVQMGAAVDYAIIYTREYLDQRKGLSAAQATPAAIKNSAVTILASSSILMLAGLCISLLVTDAIMAELGVLIARGAFLSMLMMFVFLPFLFKTFDKVIYRTSLGLSFYGQKKGFRHAA